MDKKGNTPSRIQALIREAPVHERRLEIKTYPLENNQVIIEGWLRDERLVTGYTWDGKPRPPGVVHWIGVRLLIGNWPLTILDAEAEMRQVPHQQCPTLQDTVKKVVGISITAGFSDEIRKKLGGIEGCSHMTHLILAMGPAALHGFWAQQTREPRPVPRTREEFEGLPLLVNSCRLWREGGPLLQEMEERLEKRKNS